MQIPGPDNPRPPLSPFVSPPAPPKAPHTSPQPKHPEHGASVDDLLAPPDQTVDRPPVPQGTYRRIGTLGVPQSALGPTDSPDSPKQESPTVPTESPVTPSEPQTVGVEDAPAIQAPSKSVETPETSDQPRVAKPESPPSIPDDILADVTTIKGREASGQYGYELDSAQDLEPQLRYGKPEVKAEARQKLTDEITAATQGYVQEMATFVSTLPERGLPDQAQNMGNAPKFSTVDYAASARFRDAIEVAHEHLPTAPSTMLDQIVQTIEENFDLERFTAVARDIYSDSAPIENRPTKIGMEHQVASRTIQALAHSVCERTDDPVLTRKFLESPFVQTFGYPDAKEMLARRLVDLEQSFDAENPQHIELATATRDQIRSSVQVSGDALPWLLRWDPDVAVDVIEEMGNANPVRAHYNEQVAYDYLHGIDPEARTEAQQVALATITERMEGDFQKCASKVTHEFSKTGTVARESLEPLRRIAYQNPQRRLPKPAEEILCAHLPLDDLSALLAKTPQILSATSAREIAVRRFARDGQIDEAYDLATGQVGSQMLDRKHVPANLLAIYDETGDQRMLQEARQMLPDLRSSGRSPGHEVRLAEYMATLKHGSQELIDRTTTEYGRYYGPAMQKYEEYQVKLVAAHLDADNIQTAEAQANRLAAQPGASAPDAFHVTSAFLHVTYGYMRTGQYEQAARVVRTHLMRNDRGVGAYYEALKILSGQPPDRVMYGLPALNINALTELHRR